MRPLTTAEIAAVIGVTASAVRQIVRRDNIPPAGTRGRANTYWYEDIRKHAGGHDRRLYRKRRDAMSH